jgi:rhamnose utilization protein RhaD (predicted bifunctional aldolase and dehydrogenase)
MIPDISMKENVANYCAGIGSDPLLVQGAGGNVSWKDGDTLWVKASGTWLSDATQKEIFVPVDLAHLQQAISAGHFMAPPLVRGESSLRPSIETMLHGLMPHPVVIHLHAIEILAHLVRYEVKQSLSLSLGSKIRWTYVDYQKPGSDLAHAVREALLGKPCANVVFLQNHGVVIGGSDIFEVDVILKSLLDMLQILPRTASNILAPNSAIAVADSRLYAPIQDKVVHQLATDMALFERLASDWALYPDHVVFLGESASTYESIDDLIYRSNHMTDLPELIFVRGTGVFAETSFSLGKQAQLRCYYDVLTRQAESAVLNSLNSEQIAELLNWDAEKYRIQVTKT